MTDLDTLDAITNDAYDAALSAKRSFQFTNLREFEGMEGPGYSATITRDGKKVGKITDAGNGGAPVLRLLPADRTAFMAEARTFFPDDQPDWLVEETYCAILGLAGTFARKRSAIAAITTPECRLGDGSYLALAGVSSEPADTACWLLSPASGVADASPRVWVKTEARFVPAEELIG